MRLVAFGLGAGVMAAACLAIHTSTLWLGVAACVLLVASMIVFTAPVLARDARPPKREPSAPPSKARITL